MSTRAEIDQEYQAALREAEAYKTNNDLEKYNQLRIDAAERRGNALEAFAREADLAAARAAAINEFPDADPDAVHGGSVEEIKAAAKRSHDFIAKRAEKAVEEYRKTNRIEAARGFAGTSVPRSEILGQGQTSERTAAVIVRELQEAKARGETKRVMELMREQGRMKGLDVAVSEATRLAAEARRE